MTYPYNYLHVDEFKKNYKIAGANLKKKIFCLFGWLVKFNMKYKRERERER
jgi:hypothetical protein